MTDSCLDQDWLSLAYANDSRQSFCYIALLGSYPRLSVNSFPKKSREFFQYFAFNLNIIGLGLMNY